MQDDMRRRKFDQIERQDAFAEKILDWANNFDTRSKGRQQVRAERRSVRRAKRAAK